MMVRERTRSLIHINRLHRHRHDDKRSTESDSEVDINQNKIKELEDKLKQEREEFQKRDKMRIDQINALVAQLDMLGVEPAVRLDNASVPMMPVAAGSSRRSLDMSVRKNLSHSSLVFCGSLISDEDDEDSDEEDERNEQIKKNKSNHSLQRRAFTSSSLSNSSEEEALSGRDVVIMASPRLAHSNSGSSGSNASENDSVCSIETSPPSRTATAPGSSNLSLSARGGSLGNNEALQLRLHELETIMQEQDAQHQEEIDQLTQQLDDAKNLIAQYQNLLSESEVALHRVETAAGLRSAIAAKPSHISLSDGEFRVITQNDQVKNAISSLVEALDGSKAQNSGPTMRRVYDILHELNDDSLMIH